MDGPYRSTRFRELPPDFDPGHLRFDEESLYGLIREMLSNGRLKLPAKPATRGRYVDLRSVIPADYEAEYLLADWMRRRGHSFP